MLVEEVKNKKLLNSLYTKWNSQNSKITPEIAEFIYLRFKGGSDDEGNQIAGIQNSLSPKKLQAANFLRRYSGNYGKPRFEPSDLRSIEKYSIEQIIFLLNQFGIKLNLNKEEKKTYFFEDPIVSKSEWAEKSKDLWFGDDYKVYDDGKGFRIYQPLTQKDSISFGFYQDYVVKNNFSSGNKWCVTAFSGDRYSNLWESYRKNYNGGRTFWFVIDETKEKNDQFYMSALQKLGEPDHGYPYKITNLPNTNGDASVKIDDPDKPKESLYHIYPQLRENNILGNFESIPFDESKEMDLKVDELTRLLGRIDERPGEYNFSIQDPDVKRAYINRGYELKEIESFESLDDQDVRLYFEVRSQQNNPYDIVSSYNLLTYLTRKRSADLIEFIDQFYKRHGSSTIDVYRNVLQTSVTEEFDIKRSETLKVVKDKGTGLLGIISYEFGDFFKYEGITYSPEYSEVDTLYGSFDLSGSKSTPESPSNDEEDLQEQMDDAKTYIVQIFSKTNSRDHDHNFYTLNDTSDYSAEVIVLTHKTWKSIGEPAFIDSDSDEFDFEKQYDDVSSKFDRPINEKGGY